MPVRKIKPKQASHVQHQPRAQALAPSSPSQHSSSSSSSVSGKKEPPAVPSPNRRITRSISKAQLAHEEVPTGVDERTRNERQGSPEAGYTDEVVKEASSPTRTLKRRKSALANKQTPQPLAGEPSSAQNLERRPSQLISAWAATVEGRPSSRPSPYSGVADTRNFWRAHGWVTPDSRDTSTSSDMASRPTIASVSENPSTAQGTQKTKKSAVKPKSADFSQVLLDHNISYVRTDDESIIDIKEVIKQNFPIHRTEYGNPPADDGERRWRHDILKCEDSNEAIFQRTIMMDIIERHELNEKLNFMCEATWESTRMPRHPYKTANLTLPKPDLAVAFMTSSLLPATYTMPAISRLGDLAGHIFAEGRKGPQTARAFHFFSIEVKGKLAPIDNNEAENQNLNTAAQALHNIYKLMKAAGLEAHFFKDVRFFSIVATRVCFNLRVHRPVQVNTDQRFDLDYEAGYEFDELLSIKTGYTRAMATKAAYNILFHYGVEILHPILKEALEIVLKKNPGVPQAQTGRARARRVNTAAVRNKGIAAAAATLREQRVGLTSGRGLTANRGSSVGARRGRGEARTRQPAQETSSPNKRGIDDELTNSFESQTSQRSQRRRFENLGVNDHGENDGHLD